MPDCRRLFGALLGIALLAVLLPVLDASRWPGLVAMLAIWGLLAWVAVALRRSGAAESAPVAAAPDNELGTFLSSMGHDLRQPVQAASLFAATLSAHPLPESSQKLVQGLETALHQVSEQLEAVFALAKLQAGRVGCEPVPLAIDAVLADLVNAHLDEAHDKGLHLRHVATRRRVLADEALLRRVIDRMLAHALAVTSEGGAVLGCRRRGDAVWVEVRDSSAIADAALLQQAFVPGSAYGQNLADRGLGLVLAQQLAARMGAGLSLAHGRHGGRVLRLILPRVA